jgi:hypothetical protein
MQAVAHRFEDRLPLSIRVDLCSLDIRNRAHECITENVSPHGARVVSNEPWKLNDRLNVRSSRGDFRARARVVYCDALGVNSFAIGLQLLASAGDWK